VGKWLSRDGHSAPQGVVQRLVERHAPLSHASAHQLLGIGIQHHPSLHEGSKRIIGRLHHAAGRRLMAYKARHQLTL
jgi:hypothetical protein